MAGQAKVSESVLFLENREISILQKIPQSPVVAHIKLRCTTGKKDVTPLKPVSVETGGRGSDHNIVSYKSFQFGLVFSIKLIFQILFHSFNRFSR